MKWSYIILMLMLYGCVTIDRKREEKKLTESDSVQVLADAVLVRGEPAFLEIGELLRKKRSAIEVRSLIERKLRTKSLTESQYLNGIKFFRLLRGRVDLDMMKQMISSDSVNKRRMGWLLVSQSKSEKAKRFAENWLSLLIMEDRDDEALLPEMALAAKAHQLKSVYTIVRQGLLTTGNAAFARAMLALDPDKASMDFMDYLSLTDFEDLRQLNQQKVNPLTCALIFDHFRDHAVPVLHPEFGRIFEFAVSRNRVLANKAQRVLELVLLSNKERLASFLASLSVKAQLAWVEQVARSSDPQVKPFLFELRTVTAHNAVLDEIKAAVR